MGQCQLILENEKNHQKILYLRLEDMGTQKVQL
jgi:hypothetical protein